MGKRCYTVKICKIQTAAWTAIGIQRDVVQVLTGDSSDWLKWRREKGFQKQVWGKQEAFLLWSCADGWGRHKGISEREDVLSHFWLPKDMLAKTLSILSLIIQEIFLHLFLYSSQNKDALILLEVSSRCCNRNCKRKSDPVSLIPAIAMGYSSLRLGLVCPSMTFSEALKTTQNL